MHAFEVLKLFISNLQNPYKDGYAKLIMVSCQFFFFYFFLWVDSFNRGNSSWSDIEYFVNSYSSILQFDKQELNLQSEQLVDFQTLFEKELPNGALADAIIKELEDEDGKTQNQYIMNALWYLLQSMKNSNGKNKKFNILFKVARIVDISFKCCY